jgi:hypothetical protein
MITIDAIERRAGARARAGGWIVAAAAAWAAVAASGVGCATTSASSGAAATGGEDRDDAAAQARGVVDEIYQSLRRGKVDSVQTLLATDVLVVGPGVGDVYVNRTDLVVALADAFSYGDKHRLSSRGLQISVAPGGRSAWVVDRLRVDGVSCRVTALLAEVDDLWVVVAVHVGVPVADGALAARRGRDGDAAPPSITAVIDDAARPVVALFEDAAGAPERFGDQLADRGDTIIYGVDAKAQLRGTKSIRRRWKKAPPAKRAAVRAVRAQVSPDGPLAWVAGDAELSLGADGAPVPARFVAVYEREQTDWRLVALHDSVGLAPAAK